MLLYQSQIADKNLDKSFGNLIIASFLANAETYSHHAQDFVAVRRASPLHIGHPDYPFFLVGRGLGSKGLNVHSLLVTMESLAKKVVK